MAIPSAADYAAIKADATKVAADQAALTADTAIETTDQSTFANKLNGIAVYVNPDGTADIITPTPGTPPGYTVTTADVLS